MTTDHFVGDVRAACSMLTFFIAEYYISIFLAVCPMHSGQIRGCLEDKSKKSTFWLRGNVFQENPFFIFKQFNFRIRYIILVRTVKDWSWFVYDYLHWIKQTKNIYIGSRYENLHWVNHIQNIFFLNISFKHVANESIFEIKLILSLYFWKVLKKIKFKLDIA